ncbi:hypothetical protein ES332_A13G101600v1 [Gossypium tomentosum]|uniref:Putative plant transposon protein domain-containing protein n=1 Tax=Gossypium tomentosum TaxID=34277 RepID=A0A5D2MIX0_GOSTO|nr:hypothetical protein ES332_A13G101600v1 [Gossypium tomentosum]
MACFTQGYIKGVDFQGTLSQNLQVSTHVTDKGFIFSSTNANVVPPYVRKSIDEFQWQRLCDIRQSPDVEVVNEFYANLTPTTSTEVIVSDSSVTLMSETINALFELPNIEDDGYSAMLQDVEWELLQEVLHAFTIPKTQWMISLHGSHSCQREFLIPVAKVWCYFLRFSLMPSSHGSTISMECMFLLYAILMECSINISKLIVKEIRDCSVKRVRCAFFPSLITKLCKKVSIPM